MGEGRVKKKAVKERIWVLNGGGNKKSLKVLKSNCLEKKF